jgi:hypothetical protein
MCRTCAEYQAPMLDLAAPQEVAAFLTAHLGLALIAN